MEKKEDLKKIYYAGLSEVSPERVVTKNLKLIDGNLWIQGQTFSLKNYDNIYILSIGKAAPKMMQKVIETIGNIFIKALVITKYKHGFPINNVKVREASHPIPEQSGVDATQEVMELVESCNNKDLLICLLSGGGSALLVSPIPPITLEEKRLTTQVLLRSGANIQEVNTIRKHISQVKGGKLAKLAYPSTIVNLILSDVIGDRLDTISSGPFAPDDTAYKDCMEIINRYQLEKQLPHNVLKVLQDGASEMPDDTPKKDDIVFQNIRNFIVGNNLSFLEGAEEKAKSLGYNTLLLTSQIHGEAKEVAKVISAIAIEISKTEKPIKPPACLLFGGETTVRIHGNGIGGRNQEMALACSIYIKDFPNISVLSAGSDGTDGPTDATGAFVDGNTYNKAVQYGLEPEKYLKNNDSYTLFKNLDSLFITGPTGTNVMDFICVVIDPP